MFRETVFGDVEHVKCTVPPEEVRSPGRAGGPGRDPWQLLEIRGSLVMARQLTGVLTRLRDVPAHTPGLRRERDHQAARTERVGCP